MRPIVKVGTRNVILYYEQDSRVSSHYVIANGTLPIIPFWPIISLRPLPPPRFSHDLGLWKPARPNAVTVLAVFLFRAEAFRQGHGRFSASQLPHLRAFLLFRFPTFLLSYLFAFLLFGLYAFLPFSLFGFLASCPSVLLFSTKAMSVDAEENSVAQLQKNMDLAFSHFDDGTLPLEQIITHKVCRKFLKLTRLYRLPMPNLKDGVKQATYYSRVKVRKLLETVLERYGLAVIFLYSQATNETQLRHMDIKFMVGHAKPWSRKAVQSQRLKEIVKYLSQQLLSPDTGRKHEGPVQIHG
jgi:hypothetical protein